MFLKWLTGGTLDRILSSVDSAIDNETERQRIRGEVISGYVKASSETKLVAMQSRTFWAVWALFAAPLGLWWALVMIDTALPFVAWSIPDLPSSVRPWANIIFGSLFGSGATVGAAQAIASAIRGR
jgi:hypothetical protein